VTDVLEDTIDRCETEVVYACGPHPMLEAVSKVCEKKKIPVQVAVEELMACGYGVCMTCVMPMKRKPKKDEPPEDAVFYARSCTEGPVFNGHLVVWDGETEVVAHDQAELSPAGVPTRGGGLGEPDDEYPPPGN
jgi:dihydroorotate dehydrogenase electron transfer subunit